MAVARALLEMLDQVLSEDADQVAKQLEELLDRAQTEGAAEYAILALIAQRDETREWARTYLNVRVLSKGVTPEPQRGERTISEEQVQEAVERARDDVRAERVHRVSADVAPDVDQPVASDSATPERVVNTGFADAAVPEELLDPDTSLEASHDYWFCVEIGEALPHSIELEQTELPTELLPRQARLVVALFGFAGELAIQPGKDTGELRLAPDGTVSVFRQPLPDEPRSELTAKRLFFPVTTPSRTGRYRLRCNIYCQGILVQSRLIRARVTQEPRSLPHAVRARLEYTLSRAINASQLGNLRRHKLSMMVNGTGDGTHTFRVWSGDAEERVKHDVTINDQSLTDLIEEGRVAMRFAAWDDGEEWAEGKQFKYAGVAGLDIEQLQTDLARFAKAGYAIYDRLIDTLRGEQEYEWFTDVMTEPGHVQLACQDVRLLLPLALMYDYSPFDPTARLRDYRLCDVFVRAVEDGSLASFTCLNGRCPDRRSETVVCPSGFWGYRHFLGLPLSSTLDLPPFLGAGELRKAVFGFSTQLDWAEEHKAELEELVELSAAETRTHLFELFASDVVPELVYLYCHGGLSGTNPYLLVGADDDGPITSAFMRDRFSWAGTGPVVVINGCHTTAVRPDHAFELVSAFVRRAHAAGVIGTEITVDESLARTFGRAFVRRFLKENQTIGEAVRGARLELLGSGNPLGLVYLPFALAGLRMRSAGI